MSETATNRPTSLESVCDSITDLVRRASGPIRRLSVRVGDIAVEIQWPDGERRTATLVDPGSNNGQKNGVEPAAGIADSTRELAAGQRSHVITAPIVGTFYHAPEPGAKPFVAIGDMVEKGQQIGIVEAMKLMNTIEADVSGLVLDILVANATAVEFGQPLVAIAMIDEGAS